MKTPARMADLRHYDTGLSEDEKRRIRRRTAIVSLGKKWLLHKDNAPAKGTYDRHGNRIA